MQVLVKKPAKIPPPYGEHLYKREKLVYQLGKKTLKNRWLEEDLQIP